jgi:hypothetical protein
MDQLTRSVVCVVSVCVCVCVCVACVTWTVITAVARGVQKSGSENQRNNRCMCSRTAAAACVRGRPPAASSES